MRDFPPEGPELPDDLSELLHHLEAEWPREGCGVLLRDTARGTWRVRPLRNAYDEPRARTAWCFEPREWLGVLQEADARGERIACVYHSHVETGAYLSAEDRRQAAPEGEPLLPGASYLVVAVRGGRAREAGLFWWELEDFQGRPVSLES